VSIPLCTFLQLHDTTFQTYQLWNVLSINYCI
jgi:hypothetical protein